jgi:hypothetical protein
MGTVQKGVSTWHAPRLYKDDTAMWKREPTGVQAGLEYFYHNLASCKRLLERNTISNGTVRYGHKFCGT